MESNTALIIIQQNETLKELFIKEFKEFLDDHDEAYFEPLDADQVLALMINQGYWSGVQYRVYWTLYGGFNTTVKSYG